MGGLSFWLGCGCLGRLFLWAFRLLTQVNPAQAAIDSVVLLAAFFRRDGLVRTVGHASIALILGYQKSVDRCMPNRVAELVGARPVASMWWVFATTGSFVKVWQATTGSAQP